jgi:hypothetical protein
VTRFLILALVAVFPLPAIADDETENTKIEIQAPLEAVNCAGLPPTITVLGLVIDISKAGININTEGETPAEDVTCADLVPGQVVEVKFASDAPDLITGLLSAVEVDIGGGDCEDDVCDTVKVEGPIQAVAAPTITVLGLVIDISQAQLQNLEGELENEGDNPLVDPATLAVGQFVDLTLASAVAPLAATTIEVKNFDNEVDLDIPGGDDGEVEVDVAVTTQVVNGAAVKAAASKGSKKVVKLHASGQGSSVTLRGLPTGKASILVTKFANGRKSTGKASVQIVKNTTQQVLVKMKKAK